jgi:hypothetical protein
MDFAFSRSGIPQLTDVRLVGLVTGNKEMSYHEEGDIAIKGPAVRKGMVPNHSITFLKFRRVSSKNKNYGKANRLESREMYSRKGFLRVCRVGTMLA